MQNNDKYLNVTFAFWGVLNTVLQMVYEMLGNQTGLKSMARETKTRQQGDTVSHTLYVLIDVQFLPKLKTWNTFLTFSFR